MIDLEKLNEFYSAIEKVIIGVCEHAQKDLKSNCTDKCPYKRLCDILIQAKSRMLIMKYNPENPNKGNEMNKKQLDVLNRVHDFLRFLIRENLIKDAPSLGAEPMLQVSDLAYDVYKAIHDYPLRNCDVGTPEEQLARFKKQCDRHSETHGNCFGCPCLKTSGVCEFHWAQMPYEEGGAE